MDGDLCQLFFLKYFYHALSGVRVQKVQRVQRGKVLRIDRPDGRRVLRFDGLSGRGLWYRPAGDELYSFPSVLHTGAHLSARDDDVGVHPYRHFDRSEAEWRNLTPPWFMKHWDRRSPGSELHIA